MTDSHANRDPRRPLRPIMLAGTGSDVGKSLIATGLCRIFRQDGYHPAPFKAQNMALNSAATPDGLEIGRAQAVQAEAAGAEACSDMNPLLLKPSSDRTSQVVLNGRPIGNRDAYEYYRAEGREYLRNEVIEAFRRLERRYNPIVMEGAGSIAELNLSHTDLVNMSMAVAADASVILVADIDRGGVFASCYGSVMLQEPENRSRIKGLIINKFRGDLKLFDDGRKILEEICGIPVLGVVPYMQDLNIDNEDSVALDTKPSRAVQGSVNIGVVRLPHISNFTDFATLERLPGVNLYYSSDPTELSYADILILPGSKSTLPDLEEIRRNGCAEAVTAAARRGVTVLGICGGYQMMGRTVSDPLGVEGKPSTAPGLGLLPVDTELTGTKLTRPVMFRFGAEPVICRGYEIHMGRTARCGGEPLCVLDDGTPDGCRVSARVAGTYIHGVLDNLPALRWLLADTAVSLSGLTDPDAARMAEYDRLADHLRLYVDIPAIYQIMEQHD